MWFSNNQLKGNTNKWHLLISSDETYKIQIEDSMIEKSDCQKLMGVKIDSKLNFNEHVRDLN